MATVNYVGTVEDRLGSLPARRTRGYATELEAYKAVERLNRKYFGSTNRGQIDIKQEGFEMKRFEIDWRRTRSFGDCDTVGRLKDGRWFWTWNTNGPLDEEVLLSMGLESGEDGGIIVDTFNDLLNVIEDREDLFELVKETFA